MLQDSGFAEPRSSSANLWGGPTPAVDPLSAGSSAYAAPAAAAQSTPQEVTVGKEQSGSGAQPAAKEALKSQAGAKDNSPPPYYPSRDELIADIHKDPTKFNVPPGMPADKFAQQYFNEFVAKLVGKAPYATDDKGNPAPYDPKHAEKVWTPQEKEMLGKWGYNADVPKGNIADDNAKSGLYALRIDPIKGGDAPPIVAFRGTEPTSGPQDLQSDLGGKYVGQSQYEGNAKLISDRLTRQGDKNVDVVGYSLGGALAQKYTADHAAQVGQLSTFQAPGISQQDADHFKQENADHHVDVNHFYNDADIVHRAGAAKLDGSFHQVKNPNFGLKDKLTLHPHLSSIICNSNSDFEGAVGQNNIATYGTDQQKDRGFLEGARRLLGPAASSFLGGAYAPVASGAGDLGQGFKDAKQGGSELLHGAGDLFHSPLKGLGELGTGLKDTLKGTAEGFGGAAKVAGGLAAGVGSVGLSALQGGANLVAKGWDGAKTLASNTGHAVVNGVSNLAHAAGDKIVGAEQAVANGVSNFAHAAGDKIVGAEHAIANTAGTVANAAGTALANTGHAISNGASAVKKFLHLPW